MPTWDSPLKLYAHQKAAFQASPRSAREQWRKIPEGGFRDLKEMTSGNISSRELARRGHPYARRKDAKGNVSNVARGTSKSYAKRNPGSGTAPLRPINRQSSRLYNSVTLWHRSSAFVLEMSVGFDPNKASRSIYAVQPKGTKYVVPRDVFVEMRSRGAARRRAFNDVFFRGQRTIFSRP